MQIKVSLRSNETFQEFEKRSTQLPELALEKSIVLYLPAPYYVFVRPMYCI